MDSPGLGPQKGGRVGGAGSVPLCPTVNANTLQIGDVSSSPSVGRETSSLKEVDPSLRFGASVNTCASQDLTGTTSLAALVRECVLSFHQESESQQRVWTLHCTQSCEQSPGHLFQEPLAKAVTPGPQTATLLAPWVGDRQLYQPVKSPKGWVIVAVETLIGGLNLIYRLITAF